MRRRNRKTRIRQYFYGRYKFPSISGKLAGSAPGSILNMNISIQSLLPTLSPSRLSLKLSTIRLYRAGGVQLSEGMRLIGETASAQDNTQLVRIPSTPDLVNSIVAVLHPPDEGTGTDDATKSQVSGISSGLNTSNAAGFVSIVSVDIENDTLTVLSPCPGMLPSKHLLVGSLKWVE